MEGDRPMTDEPILVVDDDPAIRSTVADILEFEGYTVAQPTNGAEGLACLDQVHPRLVLLDMRMPVLDGWDFARILKERGIDLPILVMTAAQDARRWKDRAIPRPIWLMTAAQAPRRWAAEIGAAGYVAKPFDLPALLDAVEK